MLKFSVSQPHFRSIALNGLQNAVAERRSTVWANYGGAIPKKVTPGIAEIEEPRTSLEHSEIRGQKTPC